MDKITGIDPFSGEGIAVSIAEGRIVEVAPHASDGAYLAPGLVDLQVNGYGGLDLNDGEVTPQTVGRLARVLASCGVTTFLPTVITASEASMAAALAAIAEAVETDPLVADMAFGIHLEGPFIGPEDGPRGAHPRQHVRAPDLGLFERCQAASGGRIVMLTLSPHWPEAVPFIEAVSGRGVCVALGHTDATDAQIHAAARAGARLSTHLGNGAAATLPRHPNFVWAQLAEERLEATFIADGHHLPADTLKAMLRAKGLERSILVSDSAALGGMPPGTYEQMIGGMVELSAEGRLSVAGTPYLAGAARNLAEDVALATRLADLSLGEALRLATENPGRFAGGRGVLRRGARADLVRFGFKPGETSLKVEDVWVRGRRVDPCG